MPDRAARYRSSMQISVCFNGSELTAKILDVSQHGMKLFFKSGLPVGAIVKLRGADLLAEGEVRWTRRGHCGLQLLKPLTGDQLDMLTGKSKPRTSPFFTRPHNYDRYAARRVFDDGIDGRIRG